MKWQLFNWLSQHWLRASMVRSANQASETELRGADAVVVAEGTALLAEDHSTEVAHASVVGANAPAAGNTLKRKKYCK